MTQAPITLGDKLAPKPDQKPRESKRPQSKMRGRGHDAALSVLNMALLFSIAALPLWWVVTDSQIELGVLMILVGVLFVLWFWGVKAREGIPFTMQSFQSFTRAKPVHSLLANDRQGFMRNLRLDAKTVLFDGSNVYHFGHDNDLDAQPLGLLAQQLRNEGYRIVCFFDANIYHRLHEHGAFPAGQKHSLAMIEDIFRLKPTEVYIVPSGVQADLYVLNALKHLPISFAVTNDRFRDYAKQFPDVMKGQWRKGVVISNGELKLLQHKLEAPIRVG